MTPEQHARNMLERAGVENAQSLTAGDLVEIANMITKNMEYYKIIEELAQFPTKTELEILMEKASKLKILLNGAAV